MRAHLIQIDALDAWGGAYALRLASVDAPEVCHAGALEWLPAIAQLPTLRYDFFGGAFRAAIGTPTAGFAVATDGIEGFDQLRLADARVRLWSGDSEGGFAGYTLRFDGRIAAEPQWADAVARFEAKCDDRWLDKPLLEQFAGTDGLEGPEELEGSVKPLILGAARFVPGTLIDAVDNVYRVSCCGAIAAVTAAYDRLVALGSAVGDYADLATLLAATIAPGRWGTCLALGLVRLGAPADGKVSFDVQGDNAGTGGFVRKPGALIGRIAEIAEGTVDAANLTALDAARPWNLNLVLTAQTTARKVIQEIVDSVAATAGVHWTGPLFVQPLGIGEPTLELDAQGAAEPLVAQVVQMPVAAPFWRLATHAEVTWQVHEQSEIASEYVWRGEYSASRTYRLDDAVTSPDQSAWVYVNATPGSGHAPPAWPTTSNAYWNNIAPPVMAANVSYAGGQTVEDLKPAESGADVTANIPTVPETVIQYDYLGVAKPLQLPRPVQFTLIRNGIDETASATWAVSVLAGTIDPGDIAISNAGSSEGRLTIDAPESDLTLEIEATFGDRVVTSEHRVKLVRDDPPSSGGGGSGTGGSVSGQIGGSATGMTLVAIGDELEVVVGSGGNVDLSSYFTFLTDSVGGSDSASSKWYKWNGSAYVALGSLVGSIYSYIPTYGFPGQGLNDMSDPGNTPASTQKYRLYGAADASYTVGFSGNCWAVSS